MPRVYIGCFGSGMGHASRMLEIAGALTPNGSEIEFSSSGEVADLIRKRGYRCNNLPLADVRYTETGEFSLRATLAAYPSIMARTYQQLGLELSSIGKFGADVVLSDSALSTVLASKFLGLPTFTVLNQLNLSSSHDHAGIPSRLLSVGTSAGMGKLWEFSDEVLLPDLPPPNTLSETSLWGSKVGKVSYIGFLTPSGESLPDEVGREFSTSPLPKIFWQVSGPPSTRGVFLKQALELAEALSDRYVFLISGGDPHSSSVPVRVKGGWFYGWCEIVQHYFKVCDVVISRAGHGTLGQAITLFKPSLLIPIPNQSEQEGNAAKAVKLGVSISLAQSDLSAEALKKSLEELLRGGYPDRVRRLGQFAAKFDARLEIIGRVLKASSR
ncbi:MAG: hypothetical protein OK438_08105 [Thaumarchaeota archaeon]|nr:hypothetical protein [Nitrososphaerota archaeon]